jgi:hypothetical protein
MLTDTALKAVEPREKSYKLADGGGLSLLVNPNGSCWRRLSFRFEGKEQMLSLWTYPDVPLKRVREKRNEARRFLADGINPAAKCVRGRTGRPRRLLVHIQAYEK